MNDSREISIVEKWLGTKNIPIERITPEMYPNSKIPDFKILDSTNASFYCEIKSPDLVLDKKVNLYKHVTTISKLRDIIHGACKQFDAVNNDHMFPNVIVWTSYNFQLNWTNFADTIHGGMFRNGSVIKDLRDSEFIGRTQSDVAKIDGHIWLQVNKDSERVYEVSGFIQKNSPKELISFFNRLNCNHSFFILSHLSHFILEKL